MSSELVRFSVTMPPDLLADLDAYAKRRGTLINRSEAVRDIVRNALVKETIEEPDTQVFATLTMVFDHHANDLRDKLDNIQHAHCNEIVSSMHVHVDEHNCLEVIIMKGRSRVIRKIADALLGTKGVLNGDLVTTVVGEEHEHPHEHHHPHAHTHADGTTHVH